MNEKYHLSDVKRSDKLEELSCIEFGNWPDNIDFDGSDEELEALYNHAEKCPYHAALVEESNHSFAKMLREIQRCVQPTLPTDVGTTTFVEDQEKKVSYVFIKASIIASAHSPHNYTLRLMEKRHFVSRGVYEVGCILDATDSCEEGEVINSLNRAVWSFGGRVLAKKDERESHGARLVIFRFSGTETTLDGVERLMQFTNSPLSYHWLDSVETKMCSVGEVLPDIPLPTTDKHGILGVCDLYQEKLFCNKGQNPFDGFHVFVIKHEALKGLEEWPNKLPIPLKPSIDKKLSLLVRAYHYRL
jgi:hypothetical protein